MQIRPNMLERWGVLYEYSAKYNLGETCVNSISLDELFEITGVDRDKALKEFAAMPMIYGYLEGRPNLLEGIASLYKTVKPEHIVTAHGAAGANQTLFSALVGPGVHVVTILPTYPQLYAIPEAYGGDVDILYLKKEDGFLPDLAELRKLVRKDTRLICINNPHNPSGNLLPGEMLREIAAIAAEAGAYLLCDETYRHLTQEEVYIESIVDLYDKGISVSGMTKVFSLAGLRVGWIVTKDAELKDAINTHREYGIICGSMADEYFAAIALEHKEAMLARSKKIIRENLKILADWVATQPRLTMLMPKAATLAMIYYDFDVDSCTFCRDLQEQESVFLMPGETLEMPDNCFRIGFACGREELEGGLAAMGRFLERAAYPVKKV